MKANKTYFVSGIGTEIGKTIVSAILVEALQADYWKPIQSGDLHYSDSDKIKDYISNDNTKIHSERFRLNTPASPHYSAEVGGVKIKKEDFQIPKTENHLIIEGAGGLLVPINEQETILDVISHLNIPVILVASYYLGSINHTLLSINQLIHKNIPITALIFNGAPTTSSRDIIIKMSKNIPLVLDIPKLEEINSNTIKEAIRYVEPIITNGYGLD